MKQEYAYIRLLRVLACLGVFITHLAPRMGLTGQAARIANFGSMGVYLFFMISGFLACSARELISGKKRELMVYYCKRLFRILPLYYAVILCNMVLHGLILQDVPQDPQGLYWLRYFFLTNAWIPAPDNFWGNLSATWTVSLFLAFYLIAPLFVRLLYGGGMQKSIKADQNQARSGFFAPRYKTVRRAAVLYLAMLALRYLWVAAGLSAYMMTFYYLHFFVLGMLIRQLQDVCKPLQAALIFGTGALLLEAVLLGSGAGNDYFIGWSLVFGAVMLLGKNLRLPGGWLGKAIAVLDHNSYAIYLVHALAIDGIVLLQGKMQLHAAAVFVLAVGLTVLGVWAAEQLVERPAKKICARLVGLCRM